MSYNFDLNKFIEIYTSPASYGLSLELFIFMLIILVLSSLPNSKFSILFEMLYEGVSDFFVDILGKSEKKWIFSYVVTLFFVILISNLQGLILEFISPIIGIGSDGAFILEHIIIIPSADINFNIALASVSMLIIIFVQFSSLGIKDFFTTYFPITGKGYLTIEKGEKNNTVYYVGAFFIKILDIIISMFLGILELIGLGAKIVSLSFRLFGNMTSGTILLAMAVVMMGSITTDWFGFSFPVVIPILIYLQEILIGVIQALVFSLLVAIFIRVSRES